MDQSSYLREQLLSLRRLSLEDHPVAFRQGFISLRQERAVFSWTCTLRGAVFADLDRLEGELRLWAQALDGRQIEGQVLLAGFIWPAIDDQQPVTLPGVGTLLVDGRPLTAISPP